MNSSDGDHGTWLLGGDLPVRRIGLGAMRLPGPIAFDNTSVADRARSIRVLRRAVDLGVNHIDTAAFYFSARRSANELINAALAPYPEDLVIATKVGPRRDRAGAWAEWARPDELRGDVEENLRQLGRDRLDVVNMRVNDRTSPHIAEYVGELARLRDAGLIRHIGVSGVDAAALAAARKEAPVVCVQNPFGLGRTRPGDAELLRVCAESGIAFVPFFAIAGRGGHEGAAGDTTAVAALAETAAAHGAAPAQIRLAWTLHQGPHVLAIPGTGDPDHVAPNVAAAAIRLTPQEVRALGTVTG
ncbi:MULTISPECIES: aldo/keto reductase [unclassified Streptomyces]|uniref:aldo/keto reductase n=1 Tax=unclassified Streptomyces TaxID=2593676 RepID=UPI000DB95A81|nr:MULTISPECIES: aldo/keto reductase [unclassified Streptomyces]MYT72509.1 aldo/keto reductase [Streptomyces sp. SID8367]RAJ69586.1 aryl-alcohol dehydrogenase-like predicted oxidoreductase [Streptomyces sp. PsTaAH-137]